MNLYAAINTICQISILDKANRVYVKNKIHLEIRKKVELCYLIIIQRVQFTETFLLLSCFISKEIFKNQFAANTSKDSRLRLHSAARFVH